MNNEQIINSSWHKLTEGMFDFTPDELRASTFFVESVTPNGIVVLANMNSRIQIPRAAFVAALEVLRGLPATEENPIRIGAHNDQESSLELCSRTRALCRNTRVITYIAPLLLRMGIAFINHNQPNTIWLNHGYQIAPGSHT